MDKVDILNREDFVNQLLLITESISDSKQSTSFAIDGSWGSGKSFVLDMFEEQLSQIQSEETATDKYFIIRYNCWEYDYYDEPLVAIVAAILDAIEKKTKFLYGEQGEKIKGVLKAVGATLFSIANGTIKNATSVDLGEVYSIITSGMSAGKEKYVKSKDYDKFFGFKKALQSFHEVLKELSEEYTVVFLIDELDRCLPEYAIKVLERLHHLIDGSQNIINIISMDKKQLHKSIQHIFGFEKIEEYLKKFIQFTATLNVGTVSEKITDKYSDYISLFDRNLLPFNDSIEEFMQVVFKSIDIREQERLFHRATVAHKILFIEPKDYSFMCIELLILIMTSCYENSIYICENLHHFTNQNELNKKKPPFWDFFGKKFKDIPHTEQISVLDMGGRTYILSSEQTLYAAIFATWYGVMLHSENTKKTSITVSDKLMNEHVKQNITELKKFAEIIKFIK